MSDEDPSQPHSPQAAIPVLGYARSVTHHRVTIERGPGTARVTMPGMHFRSALVWWAMGTIWVSSQPVTRLYMGEMRAGELVMTVVLSVAALAVVLLSRRWRGVIEVTPAWVRVGQKRFGGVKWGLRWLRGSVAEIKYNPYSEQLLLRIAGRDMVDVPIPGDTQTKREIAEALQEALMGKPDAITAIRSS